MPDPTRDATWQDRLVPRPPAHPWCLVVPVKRLALAKTRLAEVAGEHRVDLALAFALDTVTAALACDDVRAVVVVTDEPDAAPGADRARCAGGRRRTRLPASTPRCCTAQTWQRGHTRAPRSVRSRPTSLLCVPTSCVPHSPQHRRRRCGVRPRRPGQWYDDAAGPPSRRLRPCFRPELGGRAPRRWRRRAASATRSRRCARTSTPPPTSRRHSRWASGRTPRPSRNACRLSGLAGRPDDRVPSRAGNSAHLRPGDPGGHGAARRRSRAALRRERPSTPSRLRLLRVGQRVRLRVEGEAPAMRITFLTVATLPDPH